MLKLDHDRLIDENVALTVEIQNSGLLRKAMGPLLVMMMVIGYLNGCSSKETASHGETRC